MRKYAKIDDNQKQIVETLRRLGFSVQSIAAIGNGAPDLLVGYEGKNYLFEVKDGNKPPSKQQLSEDEKKWHSLWRGGCDIVKTAEEIVAIILGGAA